MRKKIIIIISILIIILAGGFWFWKKKSQPVDRQKLSLAQTSKMGEMTTHKLLVQIERPKGSPENLQGRYERGDIVLVASADKEFSEAEKTGFLILKMEITPKQAEILTLSLEKKSASKDESEEILKRRKFFVNLSAVGIGEEDEKGREMEEQIFKWEILKEKEL